MKKILVVNQEENRVVNQEENPSSKSRRKT
jgi:hypothetical protein